MIDGKPVRVFTTQQKDENLQEILDMLPDCLTNEDIREQGNALIHELHKFLLKEQ